MSKPLPFLVRGRASAWIALFIVLLAATMMHPTFASLIAIALIGGLLLLLRWVAQHEGRGD